MTLPDDTVTKGIRRVTIADDTRLAMCTPGPTSRTLPGAVTAVPFRRLRAALRIRRLPDRSVVPGRRVRGAAPGPAG